jgi:hippurate hydrolase
MFRLGVVAPEQFAESKRTGVSLPSLHSNKFAPVPRPTITTGILSMSAAALELLGKP